jgi:hypothetical protein
MHMHISIQHTRVCLPFFAVVRLCWRLQCLALLLCLSYVSSMCTDVTLATANKVPHISAPHWQQQPKRREQIRSVYLNRACIYIHCFVYMGHLLLIEQCPPTRGSVYINVCPIRDTLSPLARSLLRLVATACWLLSLCCIALSVKVSNASHTALCIALPLQQLLYSIACCCSQRDTMPAATVLLTNAHAAYTC